MTGGRVHKKKRKKGKGGWKSDYFIFLIVEGVVGGVRVTSINVQLWFESANRRDKSEAHGGVTCPCFCSNTEHLDFSKAFLRRGAFKLPRCCAAAMAYPSVILMFGRESLLFSLVGCWKGSTGFLFLYLFIFGPHFRSNCGKHIYYCMDIHYRAAGNTAGKHDSPVAFSSRWKHSSATAAVALETWSLSLFYPHSSPLASLSALLPAIRIKPAAELAVLKHCLQLNTLKRQCFLRLYQLAI